MKEQLSEWVSFSQIKQLIQKNRFKEYSDLKIHMGSHGIKILCLYLHSIYKSLKFEARQKLQHSQPLISYPE